MKLPRLLDRADLALDRFGVRGFVIDPWNEVDTVPPKGVRDDIHQGDLFAMGNHWAHQRGLALVIVAHPRTMRRTSRGEVPEVGGYDISGGASAFNKTDCGLSIRRVGDDRSTDVLIECWKARYAGWSHLGNAPLHYDPRTGDFRRPHREEA